MVKQLLILSVSLVGWTLALAHAEHYEPQGYCGERLDYTYYSLCYDESHRQAAWVKYELTPAMVNGKQKRTNNYRQDPRLEDPVQSFDYKGSGFDRGHLAPAADMKLNYKMMSETFFMSNMSPQRPAFNRGIWAGMESMVRKKVRQWGEAHVVTAPVLNSALNQISSGVSIPDWYYKIAYFPEHEIIYAFLIQNKKYKGAQYKDFLVPLNQIEEITGYDFFAELPDVYEESLESQVFEL